MEWTNPFEMAGRWLKGNLHTHTTRSDGRIEPDERIAAYRAAGYDFLALTDHWVVSNDAGKSSDKFLLIDAVEYNVGTPEDAEMYHVVGLNVPPDVALVRDEVTVEEIRDALLQAGALVGLAHPYWCGNMMPRMLEVLEGMFALEVFNTTTSGVKKSCASVHWDNVLDSGARVLGLAVDDSHRDSDAFQGWVMVKAESLDLASVLGALEAGAFYSTTGPVIKDVVVTDGGVRVRCSPAASISFMGNRFLGRRYAAPEGEVLCEVEHEFRGKERYLRIEVTDADGRTAWTNPMYFS